MKRQSVLFFIIFFLVTSSLPMVFAQENNNENLESSVGEPEKGKSAELLSNPGVIAAIIGGIASIGVGLIAAYVKIKKELEREYDINLRNGRLTAYRKLWKEMEPLSKYSREDPFTYKKAKELSQKLKDWYFQNGQGMFLTVNSRNSYFKLQDKLQKKIEEGLEKKIS